MFWSYYYGTGEKSDPIMSYILLGVLVLLLVAIGIYNYKQDKKKKGEIIIRENRVVDTRREVLKIYYKNRKP